MNLDCVRHSNICLVRSYYNSFPPWAPPVFLSSVCHCRRYLPVMLSGIKMVRLDSCLKARFFLDNGRKISPDLCIKDWKHVSIIMMIFFLLWTAYCKQINCQSSVFETAPVKPHLLKQTKTVWFFQKNHSSWSRAGSSQNGRMPRAHGRTRVCAATLLPTRPQAPARTPVGGRWAWLLIEWRRKHGRSVGEPVNRAFVLSSDRIASLCVARGRRCKGRVLRIRAGSALHCAAAPRGGGGRPPLFWPLRRSQRAEAENDTRNQMISNGNDKGG